MGNVVQNTGVNYSLYYNVLDYFKTIMDNHPSIDAVTQGNIFEIDTDECSTDAPGRKNLQPDFVKVQAGEWL